MKNLDILICDIKNKIIAKERLLNLRSTYKNNVAAVNVEHGKLSALKAVRDALVNDNYLTLALL